MHIRAWIVCLSILFFGSSCQSFQSLFKEKEEPVEMVTVVDPQATYFQIDESINGDPEIDVFLHSSRVMLSSLMNREITEAGELFEIKTPESTLGNLAADILRFGAAREHRGLVHLGLINIDALRVELPAGSITLGDIYELIPFDQRLVILELTGSQVVQLSHEIAQKGGAPVSGMRMGISDGRARGVLVNAEIIEENRTYYLATTETVANGAGGFDSIQNPRGKIEYPILVRDMFIDYFGSRYLHEPTLDQRIRIQ